MTSTTSTDARVVWAIDVRRINIGSAIVVRETDKLLIVAHSNYDSLQAFGFRKQLHKTNDIYFNTKEDAIAWGIDRLNADILHLTDDIARLRLKRQELIDMQSKEPTRCSRSVE